MSGKNSNWLSDIKQCIHYKEPDLDCTLITVDALGRSSRVDEKSTQHLVNIVDLKYVCTNYFIGGITLLSFELFLDET